MITIVGNVLKDVYLNLDNRTANFETDRNGTEWLDLAFNASEHHFFNRNSSLGGAAVSLEALTKLGLPASISGSDLQFTNDDSTNTLNTNTYDYRYILIANSDVSYLSPSTHQPTTFVPPTEAVDYLYIDRSARLTTDSAAKISTYLDLAPHTKLILYLQNLGNPHLINLLPRANLVFCENNRGDAEFSQALTSANLSDANLIYLSDTHFSYQNITEPISVSRIDTLTHLSAYSIAAATILGCFILGRSVEDSLRLARANVEHTKLNSTLSLASLQEIAANPDPTDNLELIAASLLVKGKGILAADESGGSIHKKFDQLGIADTYDNRRDYRNIFFTTPGIADYVSGIILFDETTRQHADNGQNFVDFLTGKRIIPGIKVDQGLEKFSDSTPPESSPSPSVHPDETWTKGLDDLSTRLREYYQMGLRFAKWRAAFEIRLDDQGNIITPTSHAITENCRILAEYATKCQAAGIVPIVEPEVVYDGYYDIDQCASVTGQILDTLFAELKNAHVNLRACILKCNMVLAGKKYPEQSTPAAVGAKTAEVLKAHVPEDLAGIVFLSGGQTPEQATNNLAAVTANGPFPWPVTFSFARALQDPALYAWSGDNTNSEKARQAFLDRLIANKQALIPQ
ncbi:fructose-bisphosphate aldolase class I [Candidatus Saccharibacteria bacterium]|nr:fructose-bisphosphate aldolase class I [Candidatus Saccharibacteria bacterium]